MVKARAFWKNIAFAEAPSLTQKDYKDMNGNLSWNEYAKMYQEVTASIKTLENKKEMVRKKLIELCEGESSQGHGLKALNMMIKGRIAYDEIPEIMVIDLEKYRKASTNLWKFTIGEN